MYSTYILCVMGVICSFLLLIIAGNDLMNEKKLMDSRKNRNEYKPTYEDKDGDWMLLGDVPWK